MDPATLIDRYFELATRSDSREYFAQFSDDALVEDEGKERRGLPEIRAWRTEVPLVRYDVAAVESREGGTVAQVDIAGEFPGSPVRLTFSFEFGADARIVVLKIRP